MDLQSLVGTPQELFLDQKGIRTEKYAFSEVSRPQYIKYRPTNSQSELVVGSGNYITFQLPQSVGRGLYNPCDAGNHMLIFDMVVQYTGANVTRLEVDPWRFFESLVPRANQTVTNNLDKLRHYVSLAELVDMSPEYAAQFVDAGIQLSGTTADKPFVFEQPVTASSKAGFLSSTNAWVAKAGTYAVSGGGGTVRYRVGVPTSLLTSGVLKDRDSIWPLASYTELILTTHSLPNLPMAVSGYQDAGTWSQTITLGDAVITMSNFYLAMNTVDLYGGMRDRMNALVASNRYFFKTIIDKNSSVTVNLSTANVPEDPTFLLGPYNYSLHSLESFFVDTEACNQQLTDKKHLPQQGVRQYQYLIGSLPQPPLPVQCGYNANNQQSANGVDGYAVYQTYQRQKTAHEKEWPNQVQSMVSQTAYDGYKNLSSRVIGSIAPQIGFYPVTSQEATVLAPTLAGGTLALNVQNPASGALKFNRMFKMCLPLASVDASQDFVSGFQGNNIQLAISTNGMRDRYLPDAQIAKDTGAGPGPAAADGTWVCSGNLALVTRARVACLILTGASSTFVFDASQPALAT